MPTSKSLRQAQASLDTARASWQRNLTLFEQGFIGQAALDESRKALALADAQVLSVQKQLASTQAGGAEHSLAVGAVATRLSARQEMVAGLEPREGQQGRHGGGRAFVGNMGGFGAGHAFEQLRR